MKALSALLSPLLEKGEGILISHIHLSRPDIMAQDAICLHLSFTLFQTQKSIFSLICLWHKRASKQDSLTKGSLTKRLVEKAHSP